MLRRLVLLLAIAPVAVSCGTDGSNTIERNAEIYVAVIRALARDDWSDPDPVTTIDEAEEFDRVVYAGSFDEDESISLDVQADVVDELEDVATVRFVDQRVEAIDDTEDREPVLEDGVLVLLGTVPTGAAPSVDAERYVDLDDVARLRVSLERADGGWAVVAVRTVD